MWIVKKTLLFCLTAPGLFFIILLANAYVLRSNRFTPRFRRLFLFLSILMTYLATTSIVTKPILHKLEGDCSFDMQKVKQVDSIAILTSGTEKGFETDQLSKTPHITMKRLVAGAAIYNEVKRPIMILGGITKRNEPAESVTSSKVLVAMGIPEKNIFTDKKSLNTYENILELGNIMKEHGFKKVAVISSASHMPRIKMLLAKEKINAVLVPTACTVSYGINNEDLIPSIKNMEINMTLLYEILGNIKYAVLY